MRRQEYRHFWPVLYFAVGAAAAGNATEGEIDEAKTKRILAGFTHETFFEYPEASEQIDFENIDYNLLSAAVFHETNRRRAKHDLPVLGYREELREAAWIQADGMAEEKVISHQHPDEKLRTLRDRLNHVGLQAAFAAENVAMTFGIQYESERPVTVQEEEGRLVFRYEPDGDPIGPHTYLSFAEILLDQWMESPGHRENILHEDPEEFGTGHVHGVNNSGMDVFYSVQVFFSELDVPPGAKIVPRSATP